MALIGHRNKENAACDASPQVTAEYLKQNLPIVLCAERDGFPHQKREEKNAKPAAGRRLNRLVLAKLQSAVIGRRYRRLFLAHPF